MAHFAKLDENNKVIEVNVVNNAVLLDENGIEKEELGIQFLVEWSGGHTNWKQTSYNGSFRTRYAGVGYTYDPVRDAFLRVKPHHSFILDENTLDWIPPIPRPIYDPEQYCYDYYDVDKGEWVLVPNPPQPDDEQYVNYFDELKREWIRIPRDS